ncbi:helix-turn-helix transcriptional regulator [Pseudoduganella sp. OTU4001]|uniref:helix-turn-helix transcriptional regulator n=1 Tax=Pseudoduganella sp. OTU4001 TaxID=3043854 RepID=UPI00313E6163
MPSQFDHAVGKIYDAALDPAEWEAALSAIAGAVGAVAGFVAGLDVRKGLGAYWHSIGHTPHTQQLYNERYLTIDPTLAHIANHPGRAFACCDYLDEQAVAASRFHQEFLLPLGIRHILSGVTKSHGSTVCFFGFQRALSQEPFGAAETSFMQDLIPHLARVDDIANRIHRISEEKRLAMAMLDHIDYAIVLVDQRGQICLSNQRAEKLFESKETISSIFGRIRLARAADNEALAAALRCATACDGAEPAAQALEIGHAAGGDSVHLIVLPIGVSGSAPNGEQQASAAIIIADARQQRSMASQVLKSSFGLTPAEIKVAMGIAHGRAPDALGSDLSISLATVKTHTQRIYQKTGVSRQVDLSRLIYGLPAVI